MKKTALFLTVLMIFALLSACSPWHTVEFRVGGVAEKTYYTDPGGKVGEYTPKPVHGYRFLGWYDDRDEKFDFNAALTQNFVLKAKFLDLITGDETFDIERMEQTELNGDFALYEDLGEIVYAAKNSKGYYVEAKGFYGYHPEDNPYMLCGMLFDSEGMIADVAKLGEYKQSEGFSDFISKDYLNSAYKDQPASVDMDLTPATGATATSRAVLYAVYSASYYLESAFGVKADTSAEEKAELNEVYAAEYKTIKTDYKVNSALGAVIYAAEGTAPDGKQVVALKVRGSRTLIANGASYQGWDSQKPNAFTMIIIIDKATDKIIDYSVVTDGTRSKEYFEVGEELHLEYQTLAITAANVFDNFDKGLAHPDYSVSDYYDGSLYLGKVITGTSILFTGATTNGTFSSQLVRNCYRTAAYFYKNYNK